MPDDGDAGAPPEAAHPAGADLRDRMAALLDQLAGAGEGEGLLARLAQDQQTPRQIAQAIAGSAACAYLFKEARTQNLVGEGWKEPDCAYVGLPPLPPELPFMDLFATHFRPRLGKRADGFAALFDRLLALRRDLLILETGCLRIPGNWEGDGHSTFMFDALLRETGGLFFSVDVTMDSLDTARRACSGRTQLIYADSVTALHSLARGIARPADLVYLDSYDLDPRNPLPSAIHHAMELMACGRLIGPGTLVCIDDFEADATGGKGMIVDRFLSRIAAPVIHSGYQRIWRVP